MSGSKTETTTTPSTQSAVSTQTQQNAPWGPTQATQAKLIGDANSVYASGVGSQPFKGSMVIPFAQQTTQGMNGIQGTATAANPAFQGAFTQAAQTANGGGFDPLQSDAVAKLRAMANGDYLDGSGAFTDDVINRSAADIVGANKMAASAAGRMGSGGYQGVTDKAVGDMSAGLRLNNYNTERGYMQDAIGSIYNAGQDRYNNQMAAPGQLAAAYDASLSPYRSMMEVGGMYEDLATRQKNDQIRLWQQSQDQPWLQMQRLAGIINPISAMGGTQTGGSVTQGAGTATNVAQKPGMLQSIVGGGIAGAGAGLGPYGALAGGLLGAIS